jgi:hypothetical protein
VRSQQVFKALEYIPNRFSLCRITSIALKRLHKIHDRPQDTISNVLGEIDRYRSRRPHNTDRLNLLDTSAPFVQSAVLPGNLIAQHPVSPPIGSDLISAAEQSTSILAG